MDKLQIREVREGDIEALLANIRPADLAEADALLGDGKVDEATRASVQGSLMCWTGAVGGEVAFIFGMAPASALGEMGIPWLVGTPLIDRHRGSFSRLSRIYIAKMLEAYPTLVNAVDARNVKSVAWLKHVGFTLLPAVPMGVSGLPFHPFFKSATDGGGLSATSR